MRNWLEFNGCSNLGKEILAVKAAGKEEVRVREMGACSGAEGPGTLSSRNEGGFMIISVKEAEMTLTVWNEGGFWEPGWPAFQNFEVMLKEARRRLEEGNK